MDVTPIRLVLVTPARISPEGFEARLEEALSGGDVAAVLLDLADEDDETSRRRAEALGPIAQARGAAFILRGRWDAIGNVAADGVHVSGGRQAVEVALTALKPDYVVGAGDATTRHAAMTLGECRPDYIFLGRLDPEEDVPASPTLIEWWTELFVLPCVALAGGGWQSVEDAVAARADFVALRDLVWNAPDGPAAAVAHAQKLIDARSEALA